MSVKKLMIDLAIAGIVTVAVSAVSCGVTKTPTAQDKYHPPAASKLATGPPPCAVQPKDDSIST